MSLSVYLTAVRTTTVYDANITHNLVKMAAEAGIYKHLWRPEELGIKTAEELIEPLTKGLSYMRDRPAYFRQFSAPNGWGTYDQFVPWIEKYLEACKANPDATIEVSR